VKYSVKRLRSLDLQSVQSGNKSWWTAHTMSYDWRERSTAAPFSLEWFDDIDRRFLHASRLFSDAVNPFADMMTLHAIAGKRVLEIGCGMGFHTELFARAGATLTSIDLSPTSVKATKTRLQLKGLIADVREMDAEGLALPSEDFDMVWSWGVIHHSSRTGRIVREIARVLRPGGEARIMVYSLEGMPAYITLMRRYAWGFWRGRSLDEALWRSTDGFSARFYTRDAFADLLATFFDRVDTCIFGQDADVVPLPAVLRRPLLKLFPLSRQQWLASRRGAFLFASASKAGSGVKAAG
jgi:SAM-dependent methyltransferase